MTATTVDNNDLTDYPVRRNTAPGSTDQVQTISSGFEIPYYDYVAVTYPTTSQEVYVFRTGGVAGTVVATITLNYSDAVTKAILTSAVRT